MFKSSILSLVFAVTAISSVSQAQEVYWKKQNVNVKVTANGSKDSSFSQIFQRMVLTHNYYECGYYQDPEVVVRQGTCYEVTCQGGSGRSPAWDAFYSARKEEKASKLAAAIKGIGKSSAESLVQASYFHSKPRSWDAFKSEINRAANSGVITSQVKTLVLSTYRSDNIANLGYASGSCTYTPYTCEEVVVVREGGYVSRTCDDARESVIDSKLMNYNFHVENAVLLPSEVETIALGLSGDAAEAKIENAIYNRYSLQIVGQDQSNVNVLLSGYARKQVGLSKNALAKVDLIPQGPQTATLQVSVSPEALPANNTEKLAISFEVRSCEIGILGGCGLAWDKKKTFTGEITKGLSSFNVPANLPNAKRGVKMEVQVKIYKMNSIYHNATPVTKKTSTIKLK